MTDKLIEAVGVTRHYKLAKGRTLRALDGVDLTVGRGATMGLVGESGSGKTTLGRTLVGLQTPTSGEVRWEGVNTASADGARLTALRRQRQIVFQDPSGALNPRMTIGETIVEHLRVQGWSRAEARRQASTALEQSGLSSTFLSSYPHEISGGQRDLQRMRGLTMLFISHDLSVVAHMCRDVAVMYLGRIVELAPRAVLFNTPLHPYTAALMSAIPVPDPVRERSRARTVLKGEPPDPAAIPSGCRFHTRCPKATDLCRQVDPETRLLGPDHRVACHHPLEHASL
jgi:oligopeptide/dipeptide ABC transporter ATP-binding protein